ncbi:MAG: hypothetical protein ACHQHN_00630 [Sphingobacteriales bacterium]
MPKNSLPTYAIVELLIRLEKYNDKIGDYKAHAAYDDEVIVKTANGSIIFPGSLIIRQFESPQLIADNELAAIAGLFKTMQ